MPEVTFIWSVGQMVVQAFDYALNKISLPQGLTV